MQVGGCDRLKAKHSAEKLTIPGSIDKKFCVDFDIAGGLYPLKLPTSLMTQRAYFQLIQIDHAGFDRSANQMGVEVGPKPVRVGVDVIGTGGNHQGVVVRLVRRVGLSGHVAEEAEAAFRAAADARISRLPGAVFGEGLQPVQAEAIGNRCQLEIRERLRTRRSRCGCVPRSRSAAE